MCITREVVWKEMLGMVAEQYRVWKEGIDGGTLRLAV
jgi:hypothetical protein